MFIRKNRDGSESVVFEEYDVSCTSDNGNHRFKPQSAVLRTVGGTCEKCGHFYGVKPVSEVAADVVEAARKETPRGPQPVFKPEIVPNQPGYRVDEYSWDPTATNPYKFIFVRTVADGVPDDQIGAYIKNLYAAKIVAH